MHLSAIDHDAEETLAPGRKATDCCETTCLGTWAEGSKQAMVFEWALFNTLAIYTIYFIYLLSFLK